MKALAALGFQREAPIKMQIAEYLNEISHAVETVIGEIHREREIVDKLQEESDPLIAATEDGYRRAEFLVFNPDHAMMTGWERQFIGIRTSD